MMMEPRHRIEHLEGLLDRERAVHDACAAERNRLRAEIERLRQQRDELLAALKGIIDVSKHNSEAELMFIAIRKIAEHATKPRE